MESNWRETQVKEHIEKYEKLFCELSDSQKKRIISMLPNKERIEYNYKKDVHLNTIELSFWDSLHRIIRPMFAKKFWSLSNSVCLAKHIAVFHVANIDVTQYITDHHVYTSQYK